MPRTSNASIYALAVLIGGGAGVVVLGVVLFGLFGPGGRLAKQVEKPRPTQTMTLAAYQAQRPESGALVTGRCEMFQKEEGLYGVTLRGEDFKSETVFTDADTTEGKAIYAILKDGDKHVLTLGLRPKKYKNRLGWEMTGSDLVCVNHSATSAPSGTKP